MLEMPSKKDETFQVDENKRWFKHWWPEGVPFNLHFEEKTINEFLDEHVEKYAEKNLIWFLDTWVTYKELQNYVTSFAVVLSDLGIKKGDVVAMLLPNCIQYVVGYYAVTKIGAIVTGINPTYQPMEILHQLEITNSKLLIVLDALYRSSVKPIIDNSNVETVIYTNIADLTHFLGVQKVIGKFLKKIPKGKVDFPNALKFKDLLKSVKTVELPEVKIDPKTEPAVYIMTGGSTGVPKAAILTHFNVVANAVQCEWWLGGEMPGIGNIGVLPLFHSFAHTAVMNTSVAIGGWMMLFPNPPSEDELCEHVHRLSGPEGMIYVGVEILFKKLTEFKAIRKYPGVMGKLRLCVSGASPLHAPVRDAFIEKYGGRLVEGYGLSEAGPVVSAGSLFGESPYGTIGLPLPGTEWGIWPIEDFSKGPLCLGDPTGTNFGEEHTGEICVHGPQVMVEYLNNPDETSEALKEYDGKRWLLTGDIGFMNEDGTITIRDRKKQLIKYKGYSVFPKEVEELLLKHPDILEVAVAGLPHDEFGEAIKAWVAIREDSNLSPESIKSWASKNMASYKVPRHISIIGKLPKNLVGKVQRRALQISDPIWKKKYGNNE